MYYVLWNKHITCWQIINCEIWERKWFQEITDGWDISRNPNGIKSKTAIYKFYTLINKYRIITVGPHRLIHKISKVYLHAQKEKCDIGDCLCQTNS